MRRVAEGRVVGHLAEPERVAQLAPLGEPGDEPPVVEPELLPEDEEGEELRLGEVVA